MRTAPHSTSRYVRTGKLWRTVAIICAISLVVIGGLLWYAVRHKGAVLQKTISSLDALPSFKQLDPSTRAQFGAIQDLANAILVQDGVTRRYLILLQNNLELRPGGGFLGQYGVVEMRNGEVLDFVVEDANVLDGTYKSDRPLPPALQKYLSDTKKMKFRDSNHSPHFPDNVQNALYFYQLANQDANFDGVIAVNASVFEDLLRITGPVTVTFRDFEKYGAFHADGGLMKLQKIVEEPVFRSEERKKCEKSLRTAKVPEDDPRWKACQYDAEGKKMKLMDHGEEADRKKIIHVLAKNLVPQLAKIDNIEPLITMLTESLTRKDIQLWFKDERLQSIVTEEQWAGEVDQTWTGDYVMVSDANVGALKSDFYMRRSMEYTVDFTGRSAEVNDAAAGRMVRYLTDDVKARVAAGTFRTTAPLATMRMTYENTATEPSYFNSDYHAYTRLYVPQGSTWYVREWFEPPSVEKNVFGDKQAYSYKVDVLLGQKIPTMLQYTLPHHITEEGYTLKIQKQSGIGTIPLTVTVISADGMAYTKKIDFTRDTIFALKSIDGTQALVVEE